MREWLDKAELLQRMAQARRDAYNTAPRDNNDHLESALLLAQIMAMDAYFQEQHEKQEKALDEVPTPTQPPPMTEEPQTGLPPAEVVAGDELEREQERDAAGRFKKSGAETDPLLPGVEYER